MDGGRCPLELLTASFSMGQQAPPDGNFLRDGFQIGTARLLPSRHAKDSRRNPLGRSLALQRIALEIEFENSL
jgi:hypothetical protein